MPRPTAHPRRRFRAAAAVLVLVAAAAVAYLAIGGRSFSARPKNVLVITLDTIRADRLGAYGYAKIHTPAIDSLAKRGVLFERAIAAAPLTLPSHTSLFTGTYPVFHGVRDNGDFVVPQDLTTMAELFAARGFRTGAFVGAFVLDSRWGLKQGFQTYADDFDVHQENLISIGDIRRPGNQVVDRALAWLREKPSGPFFAWVHLYDPHSPYDPPSPFREQYPDDPYVAEIAFADSQIGRLLAELDASGERKRTLVVFAGDHGESFGEHQEKGHGFFAYQQTLRVPLILALPSGRPSGVRREETVSLVDVLPTIAGIVDLPLPREVQGRSLQPLLSGGPWTERPVYAETYYANLHYGWSPLTAIQERRYQFVESSDPELYDLSEDPEEWVNVLEKHPERLAAVRARLSALVGTLGQQAKSAGHKSDPETVAKLASLGYLSGSIHPASGEGSKLPSPRSKIVTYWRLQAAREAAANEEWDRAEGLLVGITQSDPEVIDAYSALGGIQVKQGRLAEAVASYREAMRRRPDDPVLVTGFASTLLKSGRPEEAERILRDALIAVPSEPRLHFLLGTVQASRGRDEEAIGSFRKTLAENPRSAPAHAELAAIYGRKGDAAASEEHAARALAIDPRIQGAHLARADSLAREGRTEDAVAEYRLEAEVAPKDVRPVFGLSAMYRRLGRSAEEEAALRRAIEIAPDFAPAYLDLARLFLARGTRLAEAIPMVRRAIDLGLHGERIALADFLLADLYNRVGDEALSREYARRGEAAQKAAGRGR
ncbi:MAG: sulfatase-like hydrolase/transferase [Acidobacteriota bacterium]